MMTDMLRASKRTWLADPSWLARRQDIAGSPLAPGTVDCVADLRAVVGNQATIAERQAVVTVSEPVIDGSVVEITVELWCGTVCAGALTYLLERSVYGVWSVIGSTGGWVS